MWARSCGDDWLSVGGQGTHSGCESCRLPPPQPLSPRPRSPVAQLFSVVGSGSSGVCQGGRHEPAARCSPRAAARRKNRRAHRRAAGSRRETNVRCSPHKKLTHGMLFPCAAVPTALADNGDTHPTTTARASPKPQSTLLTKLTGAFVGVMPTGPSHACCLFARFALALPRQAVHARV